MNGKISTDIITKNQNNILADDGPIYFNSTAIDANPQGKEYQELKEYVDKRKSEGYLDNVIDLRNSYSLISTEREKAKEHQKEYLKKHLIQVNDLINKQNENYYIDPITGAQITNATPERIWVSQNVGFIFATGAVFDEHDKAFLNEIYSFFDVHAEQYLACEHFIYSYDTDIIKKFENLQAIANGNYHICVFVIVYAKKEHLQKSPEKLFGYSGIVETLVEKSEIRDEFIRLMIKYGFTKVVKKQPSKASHIGRNDKQILPDINIQYDTEVDLHKTNREIFSNIKQRESIVGTRTKINGNVSPLRSHPRKFRTKTIGQRGDNVENRIEFDSYVSYTVPSNVKGISPRINNPLQTMANNAAEKEQQQVIKVYDDGDKTKIPSFNYNIKNIQQNGSRSRPLK